MSCSFSATLPLELFGYIIDTVAHRKPGVGNRSSPQLQTLRSCALTCTRLVPLCQVHIFKHVDLIDYPGDSDSKKRRLLRFVEVLTESPHLAHHVRDFKAGLLTFGSPTCDIISTAEFERVQTVLLSFRNLQSLALVGSPFMPTELSTRWESLGIHLIGTYVGQHTLECIRIGHAIGEFPFQEVLSSPHLRTLSVGRITIPSTHFPTSNLTELSFYSSERFPLAFLSCFPLLKTLAISNIGSFVAAPLGTGVPSFKLKTLVLENWDIPNFFNFYVSKARVANTHPFPQLEYLKVLVCSQEDVQMIQSLKGLLPSLRELDIDASECSDIYPLLRLEFNDICRSCSKIWLHLAAEPHSLPYDHTMEEIVVTFTRLSRNNLLQTLRLTVSAEIGGFDLPSSEYWSRLAGVLGVTANFPNLRLVEVMVFLTPFSHTGNERAIVFEFEKDTRKEELASHITDAMTMLSCRPEVRYNGQVFVGY